MPFLSAATDSSSSLLCHSNSSLELESSSVEAITNSGFADIDSFPLGDLPSKPLLYPVWDGLVERLDFKVFIETLYSRNIVSEADREEFYELSCRTRRDRTVALLSVILRRPRADAVEFAQVLRETTGMKDLGESILRLAEFGNCYLQLHILQTGVYQNCYIYRAIRRLRP